MEIEKNKIQGLFLKDAIDIILEEIDSLIVKNQILCSKEINLDEALGKVSMEEIFSKDDIPGYRSSVMDGYAIRALDKTSFETKFRIIGESFPGQPFNKVLKRGEAIIVTTGAFVPDNCFCVVPQEEAFLEILDGNEYIFTNVKLSKNLWIREKNDQVSKGEILIKKGDRITPGILSRLSSCGITTLKVCEKNKIGLLITGDELIKPGNKIKKGEIWESNSLLIKSIAKKIGYEIDEIYIEKDNYQKIKNSLINISKENNIVISVGGVSVGKKDFLKNIVNEIGEIKFGKIFLKPGKPFAFGLINKNIPFFGLPGNPVSAAITFIQLVWPALQKLEGINDIEYPLRFKVKINSDFKRRKGRPELIRGKLFVDEKGEFFADIAKEQSSSKINSISKTDLLIEIPSEIDFCPKGTLLWAQLLKTNFL